MSIKRLVAAVCAIAGLLAVATATAATTVVVRYSAGQGWGNWWTANGAQVRFVHDGTSPHGIGAMELETPNTNTAKATWGIAMDIPLSQVTTLGYWTKYLAGPWYAGPSLNVVIDINGSAPGGATILVYEPYWNGTVNLGGAWQQWNVGSPAAKLWSTQTVSAGGSCSFTAGYGGPPFYNIPAVQAACPNARLLGLAVNVGTYNPGYLVRADGVWLNDTVYDFEPEVTVRVRLTENVLGFEAPGDGWQVTLTGCGVGPITQTTDSSGEASFVALPPAVNCSYTVSVAGQAGWTLAPSSATTAPFAADSVSELEFLAIRDYNPPCVEPNDPRCTPPPAIAGGTPAPAVPAATPTPTPAAPAPTPAAPAATATQPPAAPTTLPATNDPGVPTPAGASPTPRPPATGASSPEEAGGPQFLGLLAAGAVFLSAGLGLLSLGRSRKR